MNKRLLGNLLAIVLLAALVWYLVRHWGQLAELLRLDLAHLAVILLASAAGNLTASWSMQQMVGALGVRPTFQDMWLLQNAGNLLNYLPMKAGTVLRANYLKRRYGLGYARFGAYFVQRTLLMTVVAAAVGLVGVVAAFGLAGAASKILATTFAVALAGSLVAMIVPLPTPSGAGRLSRAVRNLLAARRELAGNWRILLLCSAVLVANYAMYAVRLGAIYHSMGVAANPVGFLVLGALASLLMYLSLTPGSLGVQELVLGASATLMGVALDVGLLAAMIDRGIALCWTFLAGGGCAAWLWYKYPADFKSADGPTGPPFVG
jgi:uncharacterized membrane protein YbhN (UPF0104 family)